VTADTSLKGYRFGLSSASFTLRFWRCICRLGWRRKGNKINDYYWLIDWI